MSDVTTEIATETTEPTPPEAILGKTVAFECGVDKTIEKVIAGGKIVVNETTGRVYFESDDGEQVEARPATAPAEAVSSGPPVPEKPEPVIGKLVTGDDGVQRFVPDNTEAMKPLDVSASLRERDEESKLTPLMRELRELQKRQEADTARLQSLASDRERAEGLFEELKKANETIRALVEQKARLRFAVMAQSSLIAETHG